jgi:hypothetical protein
LVVRRPRILAPIGRYARGTICAADRSLPAGEMPSKARTPRRRTVGGAQRGAGPMHARAAPGAPR